MSRYLQSLKSQMIVFLHQLKSRDNGPVLLFEILVIIVGIDTVSCLLLFLSKGNGILGLCSSVVHTA